MVLAAGSAVRAGERSASNVHLPMVFLPAPDASAPGFVAWPSRVATSFASDGVRFQMGQSTVQLRFPGASATCQPEGSEALPAKFNYIGGTGARVDITSYAAVRYRGLYPGIDLVLRATGGWIKSEFVVAAGADPGLIQARYEGADQVSLDKDGGLVIRSGGEELRERPPVIFQRLEGRRVLIQGKFDIEEDGAARFRLGTYDRSKPLVIDPTLAYSSLIAGSGNSAATGIATDAHGNVYVTGWTEASNFPVVAAAQAGFGGGVDAFVLKLNPQGNTVLYATYLGGYADDRAFAIAVDAAGEAVIAGRTNSPNFPVVSPVQLQSGGGQDAFVAKLNPAGNALVFSTYLGGSGSDMANGVALDSYGSVYVTGDTTSPNFPVLSAFQSTNQGRQDAFVAKLSANGALLYSTYLGGNGDDHGAGIAVDAWGNAYLTGSTYSTNFPAVNAFQPQSGGGQDAFAAKLNVYGSSLVYSTYLGGSGGAPGQPETGAAIAVDGAGSAYVAGTTSSSNFPVLNPVQGGHNYGTDAFLTKLSPSGGTLAYSTYLGGSSYDAANAVLVDMGDNAYVAGQTASWDFPVAYPYQISPAGGYDAFVVKVNGAGNQMYLSTYFGGSGNEAANGVAVDHRGNLYLAGQTDSINFPQSGGLPAQPPGGLSAYIVSLAGPGDHTPFLNKLYLGFFNRLPDPIGLAGWTAALDLDIDTEGQIGLAFFYSNEFYSLNMLIDVAYLGVLGRDPDYASFSALLPQFQSGAMATSACLAGTPPNNTVPLCSQSTLIANFMTSFWYQSTYGSLSNTQFVQTLYQNLFAQAPSPATLTYWVNQLNAGLPRSQMIQTELNSSQYIGIVTNRVLVSTAYFSFLSRDPDPGGFQGWLAMLNNGLPPLQFVTGFVTSPEFQGNL